MVFLHEVGPGAADRSHGIRVAKLAGLPPSVIGRTEVVLAGGHRLSISGTYDPEAIARLIRSLSG